jgi:broad specificity phosphatase PhoE
MIVFAIRHADRAAAGDDLSPAGRERAELLARMLAESGVSVAYRSDAVRAARTLVPLAAKLGAGLTVEEVGFPGSNGVDAHIATIVARIKALPADTVVAVVSHSNTVGRILAGLGAPPPGPRIKDTEFDQLFVLASAAAGPPTLAMLRYGKPTP